MGETVKEIDSLLNLQDDRQRDMGFDASKGVYPSVSDYNTVEAVYLYNKHIVDRLIGETPIQPGYLYKTKFKNVDYEDLGSEQIVVEIIRPDEEESDQRFDDAVRFTIYKVAGELNLSGE